MFVHLLYSVVPFRVFRIVVRIKCFSKCFIWWILICNEITSKCKLASMCSFVPLQNVICSFTEISCFHGDKCCSFIDKCCSRTDKTWAMDWFSVQCFTKIVPHALKIAPKHIKPAKYHKWDSKFDSFDVWFVYWMTFVVGAI